MNYLAVYVREKRRTVPALHGVCSELRVKDVHATNRRAGTARRLVRTEAENVEYAPCP